MKKIVSGNELKEKMLEAVELLCETVKATLGPKGSNVIIDHSTLTPFITNDGVTIAQNIESDDEVINTILELTKEASIKTNDVVGDGTTTTLVLLEAIFKYGMKLVENGINPLILKDELNTALLEILKMIDKFKRSPLKEDLFLVASNSANSEEIGKIISGVYNKVKSKNSIFIKEGDYDKTLVNYIKGYSFDTVLASPYFLKSGEINVNSPYILLYKDIIDDIEIIGEVLNNIINNKDCLVIIAKDYSSLVVDQILSLYLEDNINVILLKNPEFGIREYYFEQDIKMILEGITNGTKCVKGIKINRNKCTILFNMNKTITEYIKDLKVLKKSSEFDEDYFKDKIAMLQNGIAEIIVGANTTVERREAKMRYEDALWAVNSCNEGILPGGGIIYASISEMLDTSSLGNEIFKHALTKPLEQLIKNAALDSNIITKIKYCNYKKLYNIKTNSFEDINTTNILDPAKVIKQALINATSIAAMLLTTNSLVINEYKNEIGKANNFDEL